jgi:enterochelin esterase-like enzyme
VRGERGGRSAGAAALALCLSLSLLAGATRAADLPQVATGRLERLAQFPSRYVAARNIDVWLPDGYGAGKRYAVLYMQDGQALFEPLGLGKDPWGVDVVMGRLLRDHRIRDTIVVAIWNTNETRTAEYYPAKFLPYLPTTVRRNYIASDLRGRPLSDRYLRFLVRELKPAIDRRYLTRPDRDDTFIMGSSRGGLISLYAISEYPQVFGAAACLSTHLIGGYTANAAQPLAAFRYLQLHLPDPASHRIYMDRGTRELDAQYAQAQPIVDELIHERGYTDANFSSHVIEGAGHNEKDWGARLEGPLTFLLAPP